MTHAALTTAALALFFFASVRAASAAEDVGVIVVGDASVQRQVAAQLETWLGEHGHRVVTSALPDEGVQALQACFSRKDDETCASRVIAARSRATSILFARAAVASAPDGSRDLTLVGYWFEKAREPVADRRVCERCSDISVRSTADELAAALVKARLSAVGRLRLTSTPPNAQVTIDDELVGVTPLERDLAPGNHRITLTADGHELETRVVPMRAGETTALAIPLAARPRPAARSRIPIAVTLGGVVVMAAGGVLVGVDEDHDASAPLYIRDTAPLGAGLLAAGAAIAVAGAIWWVRSPSQSTPVVALTGDAGLIGWSRSF